MSEESARNLSHDGTEQILARLDSIESRLTSLEDKIDQWLDLEAGMLAKNAIKVQADRDELTG
ncbi:MAG TPA: hypothetical protein VK422_01820 [Pyrinomonadaceae bacterium]|nr:hypothetical protein [Pyrinomonadaceae bacterium]